MSGYEFAIGHQIGPYRLLGPLGRGGMATVYRAFQPALNRQIALKVLPSAYVGDIAFRARFMLEATAIARLQHPNIVPVFDFGDDRGVVYIAMMLVRGGTLDAHVGAPFKPEVAAAVVIQIARALGHAHGGGLVHRDVKPSNILVQDRRSGDGGVRSISSETWALLSDFGIAQARGALRLTADGQTVGSPHYLAPEQARGSSVDHRADLYSLGVVFFELLTGTKPFDAPTAVALAYRHVSEPVPSARGRNAAIPIALENVLFRALCKRPEDRFQSAEELIRGIESAMAPASAYTVEATLGAMQSSQGAMLALPAEKTPIGSGTMEPPASRPNDLPLRAENFSPRPARIRARPKGGPGSLLFIFKVASSFGVIAGCLWVGALAFAVTNNGRASASALAATPVPIPTVIPVAPTAKPAVSKLVLSDSFQDDSGGWRTDGSNAFFSSDGLHVVSRAADRSYRSVSSKAGVLVDVVVEADIRKVDGPNDLAYGVILRDGADGFYAIMITGNGSYQVARWVPSLNGWDNAFPFRRSSEIRTGNAQNNLRVSMIGERLIVEINGQVVEEWRETKAFSASGKTGFISGGTNVHFVVSNVRISTLS